MSVNAEELTQFISWMNDGLVHYSNKVVNSGLPAGGVRLSKKQAADIPHICGRSLLFERIADKSGSAPLALDYISVTDRFKYLRAWLGEDIKSLGEKYVFPDEKRAEIVAWYEKLCDGELGRVTQTEAKGKVPFRLKQLLLPKDGDYLCVTPLPCLAVGKQLKSEFFTRERRRDELFKEAKKKSLPKEEQDQLHKEAKKLGWLDSLVSFSVGGANAQNVGGRIYEAYNRPVLSSNLPRMNPDLRKAFGIAHNGIKLRLPRNLIAEYQTFLEGQRAENGPNTVWTRRAKDAEAKHLKKLLDAWERQAKTGRRLLAEYEQELPDQLPCFEKQDGDRMRGWLKPQARSHQWYANEVSQFIKAMQKFVTGKASTGDPITLQLDSADAGRIRTTLMEGGFL